MYFTWCSIFKVDKSFFWLNKFLWLSCRTYVKSKKEVKSRKPWRSSPQQKKSAHSQVLTILCSACSLNSSEGVESYRYPTSHFAFYFYSYYLFHRIFSVYRRYMPLHVASHHFTTLHAALRHFTPPHAASRLFTSLHAAGTQAQPAIDISSSASKVQRE